MRSCGRFKVKVSHSASGQVMAAYSSGEAVVFLSVVMVCRVLQQRREWAASETPGVVWFYVRVLQGRNDDDVL